VARALRMVIDPRVTAALGELANALDAQGQDDGPVELEAHDPTAGPIPPRALPPVEITDEDRRAAERGLRKVGVLR
jgi:hypothetical protein